MIISNYDDFVYIFPHIGKCGGTTIIRHIQNQYSNQLALNLNIKFILGEKWKGGSITKVQIKDFVNLKLSNLEEKEKVKVIYGHPTYYGIHELFQKKPRYFTFLRNPINRVISHYNYLCSKDSDTMKIFGTMEKDGDIVPFEKWVESSPYASNLMVKYLSLRGQEVEVMDFNSLMPCEKDLAKAKNCLDKFYFVGLTERSKDFEFIYNRLGINTYLGHQNRSKKYFTPTEDHRELILSKNELDQKLYNYAVKLNKKLISQIDDYELAVFSTRLARNISKIKQGLKRRLTILN